MNRCKATFADVTDPRFGAMGDGVTDDRNAIQSAIDSLPPTGGTVYFPLINCAPTTYIIGTPGVLTPPLKYPSNVTFAGDYLPGVGRSTLKLCDDFRQVLTETYASSPPFWQVTVFAPASSQYFWTGPGVPSQVGNVTFRDLAIDGNRHHQPLFYTNSNHGLVPDPRAALGVDAAGGVSTLTAGNYQFYVTYTDVNGIETNAVGNPAALQLPGAAGQLSAQLTLPPTPAGAVQLYVYVSESEYDAYGQGANNLVYERQGPFAIPPEPSSTQGGNLDITSHVPGTHYPPGIGLRIFPGEQTHGAIMIDSFEQSPGEPLPTSPTSDIVFDNCDIGNTASDAIQIDGFARNIRIGKCKLHDGLNGIETSASMIEGLHVTDTEFSGCSQAGIDFEDGGERYPGSGIHLVRLAGCAFNNCGLGLSITPETFHTSDLAVDSCQFGNVSPNMNNILITVTTSPGRGDSIHIKSCYFGYAINYPMTIQDGGGGTIEDCLFDQTAGPTAYLEGKYFYYAIPDAAQLRFDGSQEPTADTAEIGPWGSNWQVLGCCFKPLANATCATSSACIEASGGAKNIYVAGCVYVNNDSQAFVPSGAGRLLFNVAAKYPDGSLANGLANHRFAANYGCLGENGFPATGYSVGAAATSLPVVFPTAQINSQYEVCPQFGWDSGNWWVTGQTTAGYTLNWKNGPGSATNLPITIRDAASAPPSAPPCGLIGSAV
jgi:hypothetical protein